MVFHLRHPSVGLSHQPDRQAARLTARRDGGFRKPKRKVKVLKVASASLRFSKPGYKGFDIKPTKRARRILKRSAKHHKKLPLTVVSTFRSRSGAKITRRKHLAIKP